MYVRVRVTPGAKRESLIQVDEKTFTAAVQEPAEGNRVNERVCELIAAHFRIPATRVHLSGGERSRQKVFDIDI